MLIAIIAVLLGYGLIKLVSEIKYRISKRKNEGK